MNERFIRCGQCGFPHVASAQTCPVTHQPITQASAEPPRPKPNAWAEPTRLAPLAPGSATKVPASEAEFVGQVIGGKYRIRGVLGQGGMGAVFDAVHIGIGRQSAIKVLHTSQLRKKDAVRRFHQEAKAAARIGHPNICEVYDLGTLEDGRPYLVMEKLVGETLADAIAREGGLPFVEVVDVLRQVLSGLHAAHENGILHRDIKPENVFLSRRVGCPAVAKLLDFGVSKMMRQVPQSKDETELEMTRTGIVLGTPYYLAPEQARGDRNLDARVDIYACGVLLYEALTGRRPFVAGNYNALLLQILTGAPRPIRELRPDIPEDLERIVDRAMSREKHQRYASAVDFQSDLPLYDPRAPPSNRAPVAPPPPSRPAQPHDRPSAPPRYVPPAGEPLRATRLGVPPAPAPVVVPSPAGEADGREALLNALPVASPFLPPPRTAAPPTKPGPFGGPTVPALRPSPLSGASPSFSRSQGVPTPLSSSQQVDALIEEVEAPMTAPDPPRPRPAARAKSAHDFEDIPTEVQKPPSSFLDEVSTAQLRGEDVFVDPPRRAPPPPGPSPMATPRKQTLAARRPGDFEDNSKTDVMTADLQSRMRELRQAALAAAQSPETTSPTARTRKR